LGITRQQLVRRRWTAPALVLLLLTSAACLVTKDIDFRVENSPPSAERKAPADSFTRVPLFSDPVCPMGAAEQTLFILFEATIRDIDVDQTLQARLLVNGVVAAQKESGPAAGNPMERTFEPFCLEASRWLTLPCNLVELLVTSRFSFNSLDPYETISEGDLARVEWYVLPSATDAPAGNQSDCLPPQPPADGGMP